MSRKTTVNLQDDIEQALQNLPRTDKRSVTAHINQAMRVHLGLEEPGLTPKKIKALHPFYRVRSVN